MKIFVREKKKEDNDTDNGNFVKETQILEIELDALGKFRWQTYWFGKLVIFLKILSGCQLFGCALRSTPDNSFSSKTPGSKSFKTLNPRPHPPIIYSSFHSPIWSENIKKK